MFTLLLHFLANGALCKSQPLALPLPDEEEDEDDEDESDEDDDESDGDGSSSNSNNNNNKGKKSNNSNKLNAWGYPSGKSVSAEELALFQTHYEVCYF